LQRNIKDKILELITRGSDIDELFYEMRDDEELKFERDLKLDIEKSAIAKNLSLKI
jgi:hypothetical protein